MEPEPPIPSCKGFSLYIWPSEENTSPFFYACQFLGQGSAQAQGCNPQNATRPSAELTSNFSGISTQVKRPKARIDLQDKGIPPMPSPPAGQQGDPPWGPYLCSTHAHR